MSIELYASIGYAFVMCIRYIFLPIGIAVLARVIAEKLFPPQPKKQTKKRSFKNRLK